jgi:hypothetical protein
MDAIVQLVEEGKKDKNEESMQQMVRTVRNWVSIEQAGLNFKGRFVPDNEFDEELFSSRMSPEAKVNFEAWLRETTTIAVNTEINAQLGEFTIKKNVTRPVEQDIMDDPDFAFVFDAIAHDDIIQCAEVKNTTNRKWIRLVGLGYDLQQWVPDTRLPVLPSNKKPLSSMTAITGTTKTIKWISDIINPWREKVLLGIELFVISGGDSSAEVATLCGFTKSSSPEDVSFVATLKEVVVYRYPRVFHIFNIVEHGRRWYRSLIFSSNHLCATHDLKMQTIYIDNKMMQCCGDPTVVYQPSTSLVINRYLSDDISHAQTFVPHRLLYGLMPTTLLENYVFWQSGDDSLTGYMAVANKAATRSVLEVKLSRVDASDNTGFGFSSANASICRIFTANDPNIKDFQFYKVPDLEKPPMYLVDLMKVLNAYHTNFNTEADIDGPRTTSVEFRSFMGETKTLHALVQVMLRLEPMANIVAWSSVAPTPNAKGVASFASSVDLIELPRLRLSFEKSLGADGSVRYLCLEQSGHHIAANTADLPFARLLEGLPTGILLVNNDYEYSLLVPATVKLVFVRTKIKHSFKLICSMTDKDWIAKTGENTYFIYPIHSSGCFMSSRSIASTLYMLALRLMTRRYRDAFRLIESCVCDRVLTAQEQQIFDLVGTVQDGMLVDARACRLKLFFVTCGCSEIMPYQFNVEEDISQYVQNYSMVSASCRLTVDEEIFIMSRVSAAVDKVKSEAYINRERIIRTSFDLTFEKFVARNHSKNVTPAYPRLLQIEPYNTEPVDLDLLDVDKPNFKNIIQKLSIIKYTKPEPCSGAECIQYLLKLFETQKNVGFFVLYDLMTNSLPMQILVDGDKPHGLGSLLFRVMPDNYVTGLQRVILHVMEFHPELSSKMPIFEDKRKLKLPSIAGLDIFQTHIKVVAGFIKSNRSELNVSKLAVQSTVMYKPPSMIKASNTLDGSVDFSEGRSWLVPRVTDFTCEKRLITHAVIPPLLHSFVDHYTSQEVAHFCSAPLDVMQLDKFVHFKDLNSRGEDRVSSISPLRVMNHPSSRSHIARTSVSRLEKDIVDFSTDENLGTIAVLNAVNRTTNLRGDSLTTASNDVRKLIEALVGLRDKDTAFVRKGVSEILLFSNGQHLMYANNSAALGHVSRQLAQNEFTLVILLLFKSASTLLINLFTRNLSFWPRQPPPRTFRVTWSGIIHSCRDPTQTGLLAV